MQQNDSLVNGAGVINTLLEPTFLPQMLNTAERSSAAYAGARPGRQATNEHLTNFVTALGQTAFSAAGVFGPFLGAAVIEAHGFRGALVAWGCPFGVLAAWMWSRLVQARREERKRGGGRVILTGAEEENAEEEEEGTALLVR